MASTAVCIGINNYPGTDADLNGCVNDARDWADFLTHRGFKVQDVVLDSFATKVAMMAAMQNVVKGLNAGETGVITYSGHGTWMPDLDGDEPDSRDEALCPYDMDENNVLLDDEIKVLLTDKQPKANVIFVSDSCHSATIFRFSGLPNVKRKIRYIPPANFVKNPVKLAMIQKLASNSRRLIKPTNAALPGVMHIGGCDDRSYSYDAEFDAKPNGAFSYESLKLLRAYPTMPTFSVFFKDLKMRLPSWDYPQNPHLNAPTAMKRLPAFCP